MTTWIPKGWGGEKVICNNELYCGKILVVMQGKKCSWHYHPKDETFYLQKGELLLRYASEDDVKWLLSKRPTFTESYILGKDSFPVKLVRMKQGDTFYVPPYMRHQFEAVVDSEIVEFSTPHREEEVVRVIKGD